MLAFGFSCWPLVSVAGLWFHLLGCTCTRHGQAVELQLALSLSEAHAMSPYLCRMLDAYMVACGVQALIRMGSPVSVAAFDANHATMRPCKYVNQINVKLAVNWGAVGHAAGGGLPSPTFAGCRMHICNHTNKAGNMVMMSRVCFTTS